MVRRRYSQSHFLQGWLNNHFQSTDQRYCSVADESSMGYRVAAGFQPPVEFALVSRMKCRRRALSPVELPDRGLTWFLRAAYRGRNDGYRKYRHNPVSSV